MRQEIDLFVCAWTTLVAAWRSRNPCTGVPGTVLWICIFVCAYVQTVDVVQLLTCVWLFATPLTAVGQASFSSTIYQSLLRFKSIESVMLCKHLILCRPLLLPSVFSSIRVFYNELALHITWPNYWIFSFSSCCWIFIFLMNIQGWFPLGLTGLISLQSIEWLSLITK